MLEYIKRVGIALSVLFNVLTGGSSNQTFSARNWDRKRRGLINAVVLIDALADALAHMLNFTICKHEPIPLKNHCMLAWVYWRSRKDVQEYFKDV